MDFNFQRTENFFPSSFSLFQSRPNVYLSHEVFSKSNAWAITPILIDILNQLIKPQTRWFVLCEAGSVVNVRNLLENLSKEDDTNVSGIDSETI